LIMGVRGGHETVRLAIAAKVSTLDYGGRMRERG